MTNARKKEKNVHVFIYFFVCVFTLICCFICYLIFICFFKFTDLENVSFLYVNVFTMCSNDTEEEIHNECPHAE